jgi:hypothetical protein
LTTPKISIFGQASSSLNKNFTERTKTVNIIIVFLVGCCPAVVVLASHCNADFSVVDKESRIDAFFSILSCTIPEIDINTTTENPKKAMMQSVFSSFGLLILALLSMTSTAQEIGTELCSCSPSTYSFTLDFSLFCPPVNITIGDAVQATSCLVSPFGNPQVENLVPEEVQSIDILELGQDLRVLVQENLEGSFADGDTFSYTSITSTPGNIVSSVEIPRALQLNIVGVNANDEPIINVYIITFTNDCGAYPVLQEGQSAGWTRFVRTCMIIINGLTYSISFAVSSPISVVPFFYVERSRAT